MLSWKFFEQPILRLKDRKFRTPAKVEEREADLLGVR
jgi:hypothetical protein